jgi:probable phosphoglycerate mutase
MRLLIIRHGDPDYEHNSLTPAGKKEAELLVPRMEREEIAEFFVSPLGRAKATAQPTLEALGRTATEYDWLREFSIPILRPDKNGDYSHVPWDWLPVDWLADPRLLDRKRWRENEILAAEDIGGRYDRITAEFDKLLEAHGYRRNGLLYDAIRPNKKTLAFFCHFGLGCVLLSHLMNCSPMVLWQGTAIAPSSVSVLNTEERRPGLAVFRAAALGDISHLYIAGTEPSFAARFCEVYGNGDRID